MLEKKKQERNFPHIFFCFSSICMILCNKRICFFRFFRMKLLRRAEHKKRNFSTKEKLTNSAEIALDGEKQIFYLLDNSINQDNAFRFYATSHPVNLFTRKSINIHINKKSLLLDLAENRKSLDYELCSHGILWLFLSKSSSWWC